jgi:hypothetical protein
VSAHNKMTEVKVVISVGAGTAADWTAALCVGWRIGALFTALNNLIFGGVATVARPSS